MTVEVKLNYSESGTTQNSGKFYVSIEYPSNLRRSMNVLGNVSYNLCNASNNDSNICPLKPGSQLDLLFVIPGSIVSNQSINSGVYLARGSIWGDDNLLLGCLKVLFQFNTPAPSPDPKIGSPIESDRDDSNNVQEKLNSIVKRDKPSQLDIINGT